jgi:hypothetical protein
MSTPPPDPGSTQPAFRLNAHAGTYEVTADPRALAASERATELSNARFPYLLARFGARGEAFTHSDGAWLVAQASSPLEGLFAQVDWLATLLSARGMPRHILEWHLGVLGDLLVAAAPDLAEVGQHLLAARDHLATERAGWLSQAELEERTRLFEEAIGDARAEGPADAGELLASAVGDERSGIARAVPSLMEWLADPSRFSARWVTTVEAAVADARSGSPGVMAPRR